jgi:hypothetical protein
MTQTTFKEATLRLVAMLGLLAILLLGAWGIIQLAFFISSLFSAAGGVASNSISTQQPVHETIVMNIPAEATAGSPVTIGWTHQGGAGNYGYALSYSCVSGVSFKAAVPTGAMKSVACDTPFNYTQATQSLAITLQYSGSADAAVTITVLATNLATGATTAQASGMLTVHPAKTAAKAAAPAKRATSTTSTGTPGATYVASHRTTGLYGSPDLAVNITSAAMQGATAHVTFVVENIGTNVTPSGWGIAATLPSGYQYLSGPQQALYPGDKILYTLTFRDTANPSAYGYTPYGSYSYGSYNPWGCGNDAYGYGCTAGAGYSQSIVITADPYHQVPDSYPYNNTATAPLY